MYDRSAFVRNILDKNGYTDTESILNEWNYNKGWDNFVYSVKQIISIKGADGTALMFSYYNDDDDCDERCEILFDFNGAADVYEIFSLDKERDAESIGFVKSGEKIKVHPNTVCLLKSV